MKKISLFLAALCFLAAAPLGAQKAEIKGRVTDAKSGEAIQWATVVLMKCDSLIVTGTATDSEGRYTLSSEEGDYILSANLIGYKGEPRRIHIKEGVNDIGPLQLEIETQSLSSSLITANAKLIEMKPDMTVMNVRESAYLQGSNAFDILKKAPGVIAGTDGGIMLYGGKALVYIDGRPTRMDGKELENFLETIQGESIRCIELVNNPSAKYDIQGPVGIINIKTKRNGTEGLSGSTGLSGGGMYFNGEGKSPFKESMFVNLAYRNARSSSYLNISETYDVESKEIVNDFALSDESYRKLSNSLMRNKSTAYNVKLGADFFAKGDNIFGFIIHVPCKNTSNHSLLSHSEIWEYDNPTKGISSHILNAPQHTLQHNFNLNYTHIFDAERSSEITANIDFYRNSNDCYTCETDTITSIAEPVCHTLGEDNTYNIYSAKVDFQSHPGQGFTIESGAQWSLSGTDCLSTESVSSYDDIHSALSYNEQTASLYASLSNNTTGKFSYKAGLRAEYTFSKGDWKSASEKTSQNYPAILPNISLMYKAGAKWTLRSTYSRKISRPKYDQLNPALVSYASGFYRKGNPYLKPEFNDAFSVEAMYGRYVTLCCMYNRTKDYLSKKLEYDQSGAQYFVWANMGIRHYGGLSINVASLPICNRLYLKLYADGLYIGYLSSEWDTVTDFSARFYSGLSFMLPLKWRIELSAGGGLPVKMINCKKDFYYNSVLTINKNLLEGKMNLKFELNDIFRSSIRKYHYWYEDGSVTDICQTYYMQKAVISLTWKFGTSAKKTKARNVGTLETSRAKESAIDY